MFSQYSSKLEVSTKQNNSTRVNCFEESNTSGCVTITYSRLAIIPMGSILDVLKHLKADLGGDFDSHSKNIAYAKVSQESRSHGSGPPYPWCLHICKRLHFINSYEHKSPSN